MKSVAFTIAAILTAAFSGPTWAWITLGTLAILMMRGERKQA